MADRGTVITFSRSKIDRATRAVTILVVEATGKDRSLWRLTRTSLLVWSNSRKLVALTGGFVWSLRTTYSTDSFNLPSQSLPLAVAGVVAEEMSEELGAVWNKDRAPTSRAIGPKKLRIAVGRSIILFWIAGGLSQPAVVGQPDWERSSSDPARRRFWGRR